MSSLRSVTLYPLFIGTLSLTYTTSPYSIQNSEVFVIVGQATPLSTPAIPFTSVDVTTEYSLITLTGNNYNTGLAVRFTTNGTLPEGISNVGTYYIIKLYGDVVGIASSQVNAANGVLIPLVTAGSGNMSCIPVSPGDVGLNIYATIDDEMWPKLSTPAIKLLPEPTLITYDMSVADKVKIELQVTSGSFDVKLRMRTKTRET